MKQFKTTRREKVFYGSGNLGYGVVSQTYGNFIMFFGTAVLGVPGTLMGLAVAISVFWDALTDPIIGYFSDKNKSRIFGKRHGFMLTGIIGMAIFNIFLWSVPSFIPVAGKFAWLLFGMLSLETFNTMFATPYTALGAELTNDYNERTNIQAYKTIFFLISFVIPSVLMFIFLSPTSAYPVGQLNPRGYVNISLVTSAICIIFGLASVIGTYTALPRLRKKAALSIETKGGRTPKQIFRLFFNTLKKPNYKNLVWGYAVSLISGAFITGVGMHLFTYTLNFKDQIPILMGVLVLGTIVSQPFWTYVSHRYEKKPALVRGIITSLMGITIMTFIVLFRDNLSTNLKFVFSLISLFVSGFGTGALYSLPISMFGDIMTLEYSETKEERTGMYSGFMTLSYKAANAVALLVIGVLLDVIKFDSSMVQQTLLVQNGLAFISIIGIALSLIGSMIIYKGYSITKKQVKEANEIIHKFEAEQEEILKGKSKENKIILPKEEE